MRFTGNSDAKADAKGRVFLPAAFRKILLAEREEGLILRPDFFQKQCLVLYPLSVWNTMVDELTQHTNPFDRKGRAVLRSVVAESENVSLDSDGRILIPKRYLERVGITSEVRFIGMDNTIEIWSRQTAENIVEDYDAFADDLEALFNATD